MRVEFNPDGSIKLPEKIQRYKEEAAKRFEQGRVIRIIRRAISDSPLIDELHILVSPHIENPQQIPSLFYKAAGMFKHMAQLTISKINEREYVIKIISGSHRDSWITNFKSFLSEKMNASIQYVGSAYDFRRGKRWQYDTSRRDK